MPVTFEARPLSLPLPPEGAEVMPWLFTLDFPDAELARMAGLLDPAERERAARFRYALHRDRFIARRAQLRMLLGRYADVSPAALRFGMTDHGKPFLVGRNDLRFSASSAGSLGLCVVARWAEVGCDLATRDDALCDMAVAKRFFSLGEYEELLALPSPCRTDAFLNCWTRKEAYVKGIGRGLSIPLDSFAVSLAAEPAPALHSGEPGWMLRNLAVAPNHFGAVAIRLSAPTRNEKLPSSSHEVTTDHRT